MRQQPRVWGVALVTGCCSAVLCLAADQSGSMLTAEEAVRRAGELTNLMAEAQSSLDRLCGEAEAWAVDPVALEGLRKKKDALESTMTSSRRDVEALTRTLARSNGDDLQPDSIQRLRREVDESNRALKELRVRKTELTGQIEAMRRERQERKDRIPTFNMDAHLTNSTDILLGRDMVILFNTNNFSFKGVANFGNGVLVQIVRVKDGESLAQATNATGSLTMLLKRMNPKTDYLNILLCPEGIPVFREVVRLLDAKALRYAWHSYHDPTEKHPFLTVFGGGGGGSGGPLISSP